jgi:hypothetical protein
MRQSSDPRFAAEQEGSTQRQRSWAERPDRIALWAFLLAVLIAVFAAVSSAPAQSGGVGQPGTTASPGTPVESLPPGCEPMPFGDRMLRLGDCGADVKTLNWILRAEASSGQSALASSAGGVGLGPRFLSPTANAVRALQRESKLRANGVVDAATRVALKRTMPKSVATWYGPGLYGNGTACGGTLRPATLGVAHRTLPCGTKVTFSYRGNFVRTRVIDRGPYANGADWDLTEAVAEALDFEDVGVDKVRVAVIR